jgi:protein O-mannosyl-transferase
MSRARNRPNSRAQGSSVSPGGRLPKTAAHAEPPAPRRGSRKLTAWLCVLLAGATIAFYGPVTHYRFILWDDGDYVTENRDVQDGLAWSTVKWAFTSTDAANWHPLTWLSHALDCQFFGLDPAGHHFHNVLLHALNAVLLFLILRRLTARLWPSLLVAALFALHPLNVESVAWVAERKNVLSTLFFLLAIGAYARYAQNPNWRRYLLVAGLFAAGLMAKPMVITLPFVLLLLDYWPLERFSFRASRVSFLRLALEKVPLLLLSAANAWITIVAQRSGYAVRTLAEFPFPIRVENAVLAYGSYLRKTLWPSRLAAFYPHPAHTLTAWQLALPSVVLLAVTALVIVFRRRRYLPVGWFWFLGTLVPVIGLVQVGDAAFADRYAYIPVIGLFVMIAWGLDDLAEARQIRVAWRAIPAVSVLTILSLVTLRQIGFWGSEYALWAHTVQVTGQNSYAHLQLGDALMHPATAMSAHDLAELDTRQKRLDEARRQYEEAIASSGQLTVRDANGNLNLAVTLSSLENVSRLRNQSGAAGLKHNDEALNDCEEALNNLGVIASLEGDSTQAIALWQAAIALVPNYGDALSNLGHELLKTGQHEQAQSHLMKALADNPDRPGTQADLGVLLAERGDFEEARRHLELSLALNPRNAQAEKNLCSVLNRMGQPDEARAHCQAALRLGQR